MKLFLQRFLAPAKLLQFFRHAVGNVEAPGAGAVRIQNIQGRLGIVERKLPQRGNLAHLGIQGQQALQTLQIALDLKQLHMVGDLPVPAAPDGVADILHLTQQDADFVIHALELLCVEGSLPDIVQFRFQFPTFGRGVKPQTPDLLLTERTAAVESLQGVLQANLLLLLKTNGNHASSSFTLMTGTFTLWRIRSINTSLSNFQP